MELDGKWNIVFVIIGLFAGLINSIPIDMDSMKDQLQLAAMTGAGMAMDMAEKMNVKGSSDTKVSVGDLKMEKHMDGQAGIINPERRRRSVVADEEKLHAPLRQKRSPCLGRRRAQQTTTTAAPPADNPDDLRRRKRSSDDDDDEYDYTNNFSDGGGDERTFADRTREIGEKIRQVMKEMLEVLHGAVERLKMSLQNNQSDMQ